MRETATAIIASASRAKATAKASRSLEPPLAVEDQVANDGEDIERDPEDREHDERRGEPCRHGHVLELGRPSEGGDRPDRDRRRAALARPTSRSGGRAEAPRRSRSSADAAASAPASTSPIGVEIAKPRFDVSRSTPGVASAWSARNAAAARKASETRWTRPSPRRRAAAPVAYARTTLRLAAKRTSQKCAGLCCQCRSADGKREHEREPDEREREERRGRDQPARRASPAIALIAAPAAPGALPGRGRHGRRSRRSPPRPRPRRRV